MPEEMVGQWNTEFYRNDADEMAWDNAGRMGGEQEWRVGRLNLTCKQQNP